MEKTAGAIARLLYTRRPIIDGGTAHCSKEKCHAHAEFERIAVGLGLIQVGESMGPALLEYGLRVAELCALIGDHYSSVGRGNAGEHIRSVYGRV